MPNADNEDEKFLVFDIVNDTVITNADAPGINTAGNLATAGRVRVFSQAINLVSHPLGDLSG